MINVINPKTERIKRNTEPVSQIAYIKVVDLDPNISETILHVDGLTCN